MTGPRFVGGDLVKLGPTAQELHEVQMIVVTGTVMPVRQLSTGKLRLVKVERAILVKRVRADERIPESHDLGTDS